MMLCGKEGYEMDQKDREGGLVRVTMRDFEIAQKRKGKRRRRQMKMESYVLSYDVYRLEDLLEDLVDFQVESDRIAEASNQTAVIMQNYDDEETDIVNEKVDDFFQDRQEDAQQSQQIQEKQPISQRQRLEGIKKLSEEYFTKLNKLSFEDKNQLKPKQKKEEHIVDYSKNKPKPKQEETLTDGESEQSQPAPAFTMQQLLPYFLNSSEGPTSDQIDQMLAQVKLAFSPSPNSL